MSARRCLTIILTLLIAAILGCLGPGLDESACLLGGCGVIRLGEEVELPPLWEAALLWVVLGVMLVCTVTLLLVGLGYFAQKYGWL